MTAQNVEAQRGRILVLCPFPQDVAAGQRLKYEQYLDDWRRQGFEVDVSSFMDMPMWDKIYVKGHYITKILGTVRGHIRRIRDLLRVSSYDVVYVFMWVTPFGTSLFERAVRLLGRKLIFDVEDNLFAEQRLAGEHNPNHLVSLIKGPHKARFLVASADHVISSSPFLGDFCRTLNKRRRCTYITSSVDTDRFLPVNPYSNDEAVVVGWTGTFSSRIYLDMLRGVFQTLAKRVRYKLKLITNFDYDLQGVDLEVVRWTREREVEDLQTFDIGVYPLPINDWVLGKSGLKAIQYMAFGVPPVATAVGTAPMIIRHGENGLLVKTDEEWIGALETLIKNPDLRAKLGRAARADAVAKYSKQAISLRYRQVLEDVLKG